MVFHPDMEPFNDNWFAIGWLQADQQYAQGSVPAAFLPKLQEFARRWGKSSRALGLGVRMGVHTCEFCGNVHRGGQFVVPSGDRLYYAPDMIDHYVETHGYAPPPEFIEAVLACPLPGTPEYEAAVSRFRMAPGS